MTEVRINRKAADRAASGHPWIFASDITDRGGAQPGEAVKVIDPRNRPLGMAHHSSTSQIALRLLTTDLQPIDRSFYHRRLNAAELHRRHVVRDSDAYRLVHAEADLLPGLIIDRYGDYFVMQTLDQGMDAVKADLAWCLEDLFHPRGIVARNDAAVRTKEDLPLETSILLGEVPDCVQLRMNGLTLRADLLHGQKTGIFLDQRENYLAAAQYGRGGRALDCFTSTGGFALHLARTCATVEAIDSSAHAIDTAKANAAANAIGNIAFREADVFEFLAGARGGYELIVLDPPAFAKSRRHVDAAITA
jgi:23S rRNA (cytosine1962-C5)-methyltransferase